MRIIDSGNYFPWKSFVFKKKHLCHSIWRGGFSVSFCWSQRIVWCKTFDMDSKFCDWFVEEESYIEEESYYVDDYDIDENELREFENKLNELSEFESELKRNWYKQTGEILTRENFGEALKDLMRNPQKYSRAVQQLAHIYSYYYNSDKSKLHEFIRFMAVHIESE